MTKSTKPAPETRFVPARLPWLIAGVAFLFYAATLNHWVSLNNLSFVARSARWLWGPELLNPVFLAVTYPFRWLPTNAAAVAFNVFSMVCGVLSLALLARSVALLPHDRTQHQRLREKTKHGLLSRPTAWIPPVLAAAVCGLQLTFWENATSGANDLFDVLLVAYIVRNLLEYRINGKDSWLFRAAVVCGAAMANGWLMVLFFPAFLAAVIWIKGFEFFKARFFLRMSLCGAAGMLFYLLLPLVHVLSADHAFSFWQALKYNLAQDKQAFLFFVRYAPFYKRLLLATITFVPLLVMGVRWVSNFGDPSKMGSALTMIVFHLAHGTLLGLGLWLAFDPVFSPRQIGFSIPAIYYLSALSVGYFTGYFLLVFTPLPDRMGRTPQWMFTANRIAFGTIALLLVLVPVGLLARNFPQIRMSNGPALKNYASQLIRQIPDRAVIYSDDSQKLLLARAALTQAGKAGEHLFLDTQLLKYPGYHAYQQKLHPNEWPNVVVDPRRTNEIGGRALIQLMARLATSNTVCYLHPSFGYYFEIFDERPHGLSLTLNLYPTNSLSGPPLSESEIAANEQFWTANQAELARLAPFVAAPSASTNVSLSRRLTQFFHIPFQTNATAAVLGSYYSQALNSWGVTLQRIGKLQPAAEHFQTALELFPANLAAAANRSLNADLQAGRRLELRTPRSMDEELGQYQAWDQVLRDTGPFDDPTHCFALALTFAQGNLYRQAAQQLERTHALVPDNVQATFWLARLYVMNQMAPQARILLAGLTNKMEDLAATGIRRVDYLQTEATALFADNEPERANRLLEGLIENNAKDPRVLAAVVQVASAFKSYTNALAAVERLIALKPDDASAWFSQGVFRIQVKDLTNAIPSLSRALDLQTNYYSAQLYRAVAYLTVSNLPAAEKDYQRLEKIFPESNEVNSGLAEIAWRRKDTNAAIRYYTLCLKNTPVASEQARYFSDRINSLQNPAPR